MSPTPSRLVRLTLGLLLSLPGAWAWASSVNGAQAVNSSVVNSCVINTLDSVSLGTYQPLNTSPATGMGQVHLTCTKNAAVSTIPSSGGSSMTGPSGSIAYALYIDSSFTKIWGGATYSYATYDFAATNTPVNVNLSQGVSFASCQQLGNGLIFFYNPTKSLCAYNFNSSDPSAILLTFSGSTINLTSYTSTGSQTTLNVASNNVTGSSFYIPSELSSQVSGLTYTVPVAITGNAQALSGTSTSVKTPLVLTYYAKAPAQQDVTPGTYVDTVTVSVTF